MMNDNKNIRIYTAFIFLMMALGSEVFNKMFSSPDLSYFLKQAGLVIVLIVLAYGLAFFLVKGLKLRLKGN